MTSNAELDRIFDEEATTEDSCCKFSHLWRENLQHDYIYERGDSSMNCELTLKTHAEYDEIISSLARTRTSAFRAVNRELISMYWKIGDYVSDKVKNGGWGKYVVSDFAHFIQAEPFVLTLLQRPPTHLTVLRRERK
ncbi:MAG: DUF1016 N-terminal domain-containing protein [Christensenellaceae bacterium]|nr:DUF1016 N-terminal domain-containing protein [Christensenellaceae bacterium]